ncbi:hypothetical protein [Allomesorhizobium alhagi]|uniref:Uncharacterized protein n=1 Tax=Mesorhizobium alhagi CCNWXJ12-2 TaxID=1107882 RepID=H0HNJ9_9HYPH|nr:hypothetical protein [Mesorhizobium alhagi]EHK57652.1 hypothetical protein MAXJ12_08609 [Mesorhizobium alhagi CCNWXJ12-2]
MTDRIRDDDAPWGKTRLQMAAEAKRKLRDRERERRAANLEQLRARRGQDAGDMSVFVPIAAIRDQEDEWHRRIRRADDTRNFTSRALGDPLPGRSALDLRRTQ